MSISVDELKIERAKLETSIRNLLQVEINKFISATGVTPKFLEINTSVYSSYGCPDSFKIVNVEVGISV